MLRNGVLFLVLTTLIGCSSTPKVFDDPVAKMLQRDESAYIRMDAAKQAEQQMPDSPKRIDALEEMAWKRTHPAELRNYAIDQLIARDEESFREQLYVRASLLSDWEVIEHVFDTGIERNWPDFDVFIVKHYSLQSHGTADRDRMERKYLKKLHPDKSPEQVVFDVFADFDDSIPVREQRQAWHLLSRLNTRDELLALLNRSPDTTALAIDLKACARDLRTVPTNKEGLLWLAYLRDPQRADYWSQARAVIARLNEAQSKGFELRHIAPLIHAGDSVFAASRGEMVQSVAARIEGQRHYLIGPTYDGGNRSHPQRFTHAVKDLSWGDLVALDVLLSAVRQSDIVSKLFVQADADHKNETTEYGGVIDVGDDGRYRLSLYRPRMLIHDLKFIPPDEMIDHLYTGLAHYHFHAQNYENDTYAGPGMGDMKAADNLNFSFIVFTFVGRNAMNVDYFQPGRTVVDLGTITR